VFPDLTGCKDAPVPVRGENTGLKEIGNTKRDTRSGLGRFLLS